MLANTKSNFRIARRGVCVTRIASHIEIYRLLFRNLSGTSRDLSKTVRHAPFPAKPPKKSTAKLDPNQNLVAPSPAVESSIEVEDAVENHGLYRIFVFALVSKGFRHHNPLSRG